MGLGTDQRADASGGGMGGMMNATQSKPAGAGEEVCDPKRYFPGSPRHDLKGIAAYAEYVRKQAALEADLDDEAKRRLQAWEGEGGAHA
jgi:hypothetical protein